MNNVSRSWFHHRDLLIVQTKSSQPSFSSFLSKPRLTTSTLFLKTQTGACNLSHLISNKKYLLLYTINNLFLRIPSSIYLSFPSFLGALRTIQDHIEDYL